MFHKKIVQKALNRTWLMDIKEGSRIDKARDSQSSATSRLIYDSFGGEILKTHFRNGWHFYNRIDGERIDFSVAEVSSTLSEIPFEDIPSTPDEIHNYYQEEDYTTLFMRFIRVFEEVVGLKPFRFTALA